MAVVVPKHTTWLSQSGDFKKDVLKTLGDLSGLEVAHNRVMIATYIRPEKTVGGIIRPESNVDEDIFQGKIGLVVKKGPLAFLDDGATRFHGQNVEIGEYILYRPSDAFDLTVRGVHCRLVPDASIKVMKIRDPDMFF